MNEKMPRTPFSTPLSGSARETELRLKNIFSGPKKRPPVVFLALIFSVCIFCGNLVSCQTAEAEDAPDASRQGDASVQPEPISEAVPIPATDLNHNGIPEEIRLENEFGWDEVRFYENGVCIDRESPGVLVYCYTGGQDYILRCHADTDYPGACFYNYHVADLSGEFEEVITSGGISFDLNFNAPFHKGYDPQAIADFVEELNGPAGYSSHSVRLSVADGELVAEYVPTEDLLPWLDAYPEVFTHDPDKSLVENLQDFQAAMTAAYPAPIPQPVDSLPISEPVEMTFASGAGAWCTDLTLNPGICQCDFVFFVS